MNEEYVIIEDMLDSTYEESTEDIETDLQIYDTVDVNGTPVLRSALSPPIVSNQVTNGFVREVKDYAIDILPYNYEYMLFGNAHLSWMLVTGKHYSNGAFSGDVKVYHIYQDEYIQNSPATTWFCDCIDYSAIENFSYTIDDDTEGFLYYASFGDNPRLERGVENAEFQAHILFAPAVCVCVLHVILQQIFRRFG